MRINTNLHNHTNNVDNEKSKHSQGFESCCEHEVIPETVCLDTNAAKERSTTLRIIGMDCANEIEAIERVLRPLSGVSEFKINLMVGKVVIAHEQRITAEQLIDVIAKAGLQASLVGPNDDEAVSENSRYSRLIAVVTSGIFTTTGLLLQWVDLLSPPWRIASFMAGIVSGGWFIAPKALRAIRQLSLDMNVLMTVAVIGACAIGEWSEGAAVVFLFGLSELLEAFSLNRARRAIQSLLELAPETALVKRNGQVIEVPVIEVQVGETIYIRSGARVPLDGQVKSGKSAINQAPITGESMPVEKNEGDQVFAGTINGEGSLEVQVSKPFSDTTLSKIIHLVEEAQSQKAPSQRFVDQFARVYTPVVLLVAFTVFLLPPLILGDAWTVWIYRALVLLVIACPCALVISTPVSIVSGLTAMARRGVLVKGGAYLEAVGKLQALAVDKTGTITEGKPRITKVITLNDNGEMDVIRIAAGIDIHSDHPLAQAVVSYAKEKRIPFTSGENYLAVTGFGAEAQIDGHHYFVGNHRFAHYLGLCSHELERTLIEIEEQAQSVIVVGHKSHDGHHGEIMGVLAVSDTLRPNAAAAIQALNKAGLKKVIMLSGDNQRTVDAISKQAGIGEAYGELLPDDKINRIRELVKTYQFVGMIGDGVNDAPAMAAATVGIAMGGAGTDTAIETADIALMQDDLSQVALTILIGRRTLHTIRANIIFALVVKAIFLVLALSGHTSLWLAILADTGATIVVIANAMRILSVAKP